MVEAMGAGLPIAASDTLINREICAEAALYFAAKDPADASRCLIELAKNSQKQGELGEAGLERFDSWVLDISQYATKVLSLLKSVHGER
jgi:glycosyltransferase involved in cell wall biosynthesis